eukprot:365981-Chlamydomonas_euryale.AAC.14
MRPARSAAPETAVATPGTLHPEHVSHYSSTPSIHTIHTIHTMHTPCTHPQTRWSPLTLHRGRSGTAG